MKPKPSKIFDYSRNSELWYLNPLCMKPITFEEKEVYGRGGVYNYESLEALPDFNIFLFSSFTSCTSQVPLSVEGTNSSATPAFASTQRRRLSCVLFVRYRIHWVLQQMLFICFSTPPMEGWVLIYFLLFFFHSGEEDAGRVFAN